MKITSIATTTTTNNNNNKRRYRYASLKCKLLLKNYNGSGMVSTAGFIFGGWCMCVIEVLLLFRTNKVFKAHTHTHTERFVIIGLHISKYDF